DAAAAHHPDVLALFQAKSGRERFDGFSNELYSCNRFGGLQRARENVVPHLLVEGGAGDAVLLETERRRVGLPAEQNRVDRLVELAHTVETFWRRAVEPVDAAVRSRDKAIGADRDVHNNLAAVDGARGFLGCALCHT